MMLPRCHLSEDSATFGWCMCSQRMLSNIICSSQHYILQVAIYFLFGEKENSECVLKLLRFILYAICNLKVPCLHAMCQKHPIHVCGEVRKGLQCCCQGKGKFTIARVKLGRSTSTATSRTRTTRVTELIKNKYVSTQSAPAPRPLALLFARRCRRTTIPRERRWRGCAGQSEDVAFSLSIFIIFQFLISPITDYTRQGGQLQAARYAKPGG